MSLTRLASFRLFPGRPDSRARDAGRLACGAGLALALWSAALPAGFASAAPGAEGAKDAVHFEVPPLPSFDGRTLDGKSLSTRSFPGKRLILFCFNPGVDQAEVYAQALARVSAERGRYNFAIAGVALGLDADSARKFAAAQKLDFPIFDDTDGHISETLGLQSPLMLVGTDADGRVGLAVVGMADEEGPSAAALEARLREYLRLPQAGAVANGKLGEQPLAPLFEADRIAGGAPVRLADFKGRPVVMAFFSSTCSHCQGALKFFKEELARLPEKTRPAFVGIAIDTRTWEVKDNLAAKKLDFFPALADSRHEISAAYGSFAKVPDILMIDAGGRILFRDSGWEENHDPDLMRMRLARLVGDKVPMLLDRQGFSGNEACSVCHAAEAATWRYTAHSVAFDSLVTRAADHDPKCVGCHVVGFGQAGGWTSAGREERLEDVGCETCHGKGGGHLESKPKASATTSLTDYRPVCERCHDAQHSLGFDYAAFLPKISHAAIASLGDAARAKLVADRENPRDLLPKTSAFAGSSSCRNCHEREYDIWSRSAHARSVESLRKKGKDDERACVSCHVTGYGRPGGFPDGGRVRSNEDLARVGCESCHGPGAEHVKAGGKSAAGVVKLGDKCDSCVIPQICGTCHDDANDPGFRFNVAHKIEVQRHGAAAPAH